MNTKIFVAGPNRRAGYATGYILFTATDFVIYQVLSCNGTYDQSFLLSADMNNFSIRLLFKENLSMLANNNLSKENFVKGTCS